MRLSVMYKRMKARSPTEAAKFKKLYDVMNLLVSRLCAQVSAPRLMRSLD